MDRGSCRRKSWSGGNRGGLFQEAGRQGRRRRTHEVSSHRAQTRGRTGRHAPIATIKFLVEAGIGPRTLWNLSTIRVGRCWLITEKALRECSSERLKRRLELRASGIRAYGRFLNIVWNYGTKVGNRSDRDRTQP